MVSPELIEVFKRMEQVVADKLVKKAFGDKASSFEVKEKSFFSKFFGGFFGN